MASLTKTIEALSAFSLQSLGEEWVKSCWDNDFAEFPGLEPLVESDILENEYHVQNLYPLLSVMDDWIDNKEGQEGEGFWMVLVENDFSHKNLIALLAYLVETGSKKGSSIQQREAALLSSCNYFKLLTIPGSTAFKIFHPVFFEKCVDILKQLKTQGTGKRKKSVSPACSQKRKKNKANKTRRSRDSAGSIEEFQDDSDDEENLSPQEMNKLNKLYMSVLQDLVSLLMDTSLRQSESSTYHTVQVLSALTRQGAEVFDGNFQSFASSEKRHLKNMPTAGLAYKGLQLLSLPLHGHVNTVINAICKCLLPNLLMLMGDNRVAAQTIPRPVLMARDQAINFIIYLMKCEARSLSSIRTLLQHLCTKVTDRAEYRTKVAQAVVSILQEMPSDPYGKMVEWFYRLSKHAKMNNRAFTLEVVSLLLNSPEREVDGNMPPETASYMKHTSLLGILLDRCSDAAPTVRARAISAFSQCFTTADIGIKNTLKEIVTPVMGPRPAHAPHLIPTPEMGNRAQSMVEMTVSEASTDKTSENAQPLENDETPVNTAPRVPPKTPFHQVVLTPFNPNLPDEQGVLSMLRRRARDEKVNVRKAALQALECVIKFEAPDYRRQDLDVLVERCRDPALSVRKQAMQSLTDLLFSMPTEKPLQKCWLDGVLPLVIDRETTLQEKCMETLEEILLNNIVPFNRSKDEGHDLVWNILEIMTQFESCDLRRYLQKACRHWARVGKIKSNLITSLESHVESKNNQAAWMLLAELAPAVQKFSHGFIVKYWEKHAGSTNETEYYTLQRVLTVMGCCAKHIPADQRDLLIENLKDKLKKFDSPPELISTTINTLSKLCEAKAEALGLASEREAWCTDLLTSSDKYLSKVILQQDGGVINEDLVIRHLFTLGEIAQLCPARTPKRIYLIVQSMVAAPCITMAPSQTVLPSQVPHENVSGSSHNSSHGNHSGESTQSAGAQISGSSQQTQFTQFTQLTQFRGSKMSNRIRAFAFIALGKLCLQNAELAKKCVAALARELEISPDPTIRNNIVIILCDLCVRYTTTVEQYMPSIAACLKDEAPLVRKQTLILITRLLQEDFLKWKGALFFRFITTLLDEKKEIAEFAEYCLIHVLLQRKPAMFSNHFMECIFHFNAYEGHSAYNKFAQNEREKKIFSLHGTAKEKDRLKLYCFMLEHMTDEQRFHMTAKICTEILGGVVDNLIPLDNASSALLKDALAILSCKEIKLSSLKTKPQEDAGGDEQEMAAIVIATAKKTLISQVVKKNVIENIVPIVVSLKHMLEKHRSPVLKDLMCYLRELMQDYKTEVKDILSADRQLAKEIEFDLRKFEEEQEEIKRQQDQQNTVQSLQGTPGSSPRTVVAGPLARSPQITPLSRPPGHPGSPANSPLGQRQGSTGPSTPAPVAQLNKTAPLPMSVRSKDLARDQSLSTLAILNSARKAFLKAKENSPAGAGQSNRRKSSLATEEKSIEREEETPPLTVRFSADLPSGSSDSVSTPPRATRSTNRAISTPTGAESVLDNITFHIDQNVTLIPPSPIPSSIPIRVYPADTNSAPPTCIKRKGDNPNKDFIYMFSPDKPLPKPKKWNVTSPAPVPKKNASPQQEDDLVSLSESGTKSSKESSILSKKSNQKANKESSGKTDAGRRKSTRRGRKK